MKNILGELDSINETTARINIVHIHGPRSDFGWTCDVLRQKHVGTDTIKRRTLDLNAKGQIYTYGSHYCRQKDFLCSSYCEANCF